ncbi:MAG: SulP family inorganic anion transporter [Pirellulaceae bacterium]|nr:SulP family inorganic anion transporter [Pirellulaceae bacterium]
MDYSIPITRRSVIADLVAGLVVFLVALPLCLGIAQASNAPLFSGILAGIIGGIVVGLLSGSNTSVSGPAAGLTAVVVTQLEQLKSFDVFLLAVIVGGMFQCALGVMKAGVLAAFVPSAVIKGLLAAIGTILILKQLPHLLGEDKDPEGEMSFAQPDAENTLTELFAIAKDFHQGAALIGILSLAFLLFWESSKDLKKFPVPSALLVVVFGTAMASWMSTWGGAWVIEASHRVEVPVSKNALDFVGFLQFPNFTMLSNPAVYSAGLVLALIASLETLLNVQAVDKLDKYKRVSPRNRELLAQGVGNICVGLIGGLPLTSVIVRSSANVNAGAVTKLSAVFHGVLLFACVMLLPSVLNLIPKSCLAAILLVTGYKLVNPSVFKEMWNEGKYQFVPFLATLLAIVFTDLLYGVLIGLGISIAFILNSNMRRPVRRVVEKHIAGELTRIELANQVSFLNRAVLEQALREIPRDGHVLLDASNTDYIDPDILGMIREFRDQVAPMRGVKVSLHGFREKYHIEELLQFVDHSTRELRDQLTPERVLSILQEGNERFRSGKRLVRDFGKQLQSTSAGQHPMAVVLSCIDSRSPAELIFDLGLGDIFSVRVAGNVISPKVLGSMEFGTAMAGARLILVLGHTSCGAVGAAVRFCNSAQSVSQATGCTHLEPIVHDIQKSIDSSTSSKIADMSPEELGTFVDSVARQHVLRCVEGIVRESDIIRDLVAKRRIAVVGAMYNISNGQIEFIEGTFNSSST